MFVRFLVVGVLATAIHYSILLLLVQIFGFAPVLASSIGFSVSAVVNYLVNRRVTFSSSRGHAGAVPRFVIVALVGLSLNSGVVWLFAHELGWYYVLAQVIATGVAIFWNFFANKYWTFQVSLNT